MSGHKRIIAGLFFIGVLLFLLSGCTIAFKKQSNNDNWKNDIVYAEACGLDGLPCCPKEKGLPCQYGQVCCTDPNNPARDKCVDECGYGGENNYCRPGDPKCDSGLACFNGDCVACGGPEQPCCENGEKQCGGELICYNKRCLECGLPGNPCCADGLACQGEELRNDDRAECFAGVCQKCGSNRNQACLSEPLCNIGRILNVNSCLACGNFNQPCCNKSSGLEYECQPGSGLACRLGFCNR